MNLYVKLEEGVPSGYCLTEQNMKVLFPGFFDEQPYLDEINYAKVVHVDMPVSNDVTKIYVETTPILGEDGLCRRNYSLQDYEDVAEDNVEIEKDNILSQQMLLVSHYYNTAIARPEVDTGLGFSVDGGAEDLANFKIGKSQELLKIVDSSNITQTLSSIDDYDTITSAIQAKKISLLEIKWQFKSDLNAIDTTLSLADYRSAVKAIDASSMISAFGVE